MFTTKKSFREVVDISNLSRLNVQAANFKYPLAGLASATLKTTTLAVRSSYERLKPVLQLQPDEVAGRGALLHRHHHERLTEIGIRYRWELGISARNGQNGGSD